MVVISSALTTAAADNMVGTIRFLNCILIVVLRLKY